MTPILGFLIGCLISGVLIYADIRRFGRANWALMIPAALLTVRGSRPLSFWFNIPVIDTIFVALLFCFSIRIVNSRGISWIDVLQCNKALIACYIYFFFSALWSDSFVDCVQRVIKDFLCFLVAIIVLSERGVPDAIRRIAFLVSAVLFPMSLVLAKYFPELGRGYDYSGIPTFTGVTFQKNQLGQISVVFCLILIWFLISTFKKEGFRKMLARHWPTSLLIVLGTYLLVKSDSKTSILCLALGVIMLGVASHVGKRPSRSIAVYFIMGGTCMLIALQAQSGILNSFLPKLGRDATLTGRTEIWKLAIEQQENKFTGSGFCMFWDGYRGAAVGADLAVLRSAHSGYIDIYLDGGGVGVFLLCVFLVAVTARTTKLTSSNPLLGSLSFSVMVVALLYNFSESSFFRMDPLWIVFLMCVCSLSKHPSLQGRRMEPGRG